MFIIRNKYLEEFGEGGEGGGGEGEGGGGENGGGETEAPAYLFGDVTPDEASQRFGYLRELPEQLRGLESRVRESVDPVTAQLTALQEQMGTQPVFDPKFEKVQAALHDYDPKLAEALLPALLEDLKGSMSITPLSPDILAPHINPMMQAQQQQMVEQVIPSLLDSLPFDANGVVNRDPQNPDSVLPAKTALQKDFETWWEQADVPTREDLGTIGIPYVQALHRFGKWRADHLRGKGKAAGEASARLSGAEQTSTGGGSRPTTSRQLRTEADGFNSVFKKRD